MADSKRSSHLADAAMGPGPVFVTTHWSIVLAAGSRDAPQAAEALATLCQTYWYPLYAFIRRRGHSSHDAQDLTQEFFSRLLAKNTLEGMTREKGKFRSFLLTAATHFLTDEWRKASRQKRGGGGQVVSLDADVAETRLAKEPQDASTPESLFDRHWALALLETVYRQLEQEYAASGRSAVFAELKDCLAGERSAVPYAELAVRLKVAESTVKTSVHRLRQRYRVLLRAEVAHTVADPSETDEELRCLFRALATNS